MTEKLDLFLDGHGHIGFDLAERFHQKLRVIGRLGHFLWSVDAEVMLLAKLKKRILLKFLQFKNVSRMILIFQTEVAISLISSYNK